MGLYSKNESAGRNSGRNVRAKKKVHKRKTNRNTSQLWKLCIVAGILCVLLAVAGISVFVNQEAKAAVLTEEIWVDVLGGDFHFNKGYGRYPEKEIIFGDSYHMVYKDEYKTPDEIGMKLYSVTNDRGEKEYLSFIENEEQLNRVLYGFERTYSVENEDGSVKTYTREIDITFKLTKDLTQIFEPTGKQAKAVLDQDTGKYQTIAGSVFHGDTFDGQGYTITLEYLKSDTMPGESETLYLSALSNADVTNYGLLFARLEEATVKNLNVVFSGSNRNYNVQSAQEYQCDVIGYGVLCGGAADSVIEDISIIDNKEIEGNAIYAEIYGGENSNSSTQAGFGILAGCLENDVIIRRCESDLDVQLLDNDYGRLSNILTPIWIAGGVIAGQVIGENNQIIACANLNENDDYYMNRVFQSYGYGGSYVNDRGEYIGRVAVEGDIVGMVGGLTEHYPEKDITAIVEQHIEEGKKEIISNRNNEIYKFDVESFKSKVQNAVNDYLKFDSLNYAVKQAEVTLDSCIIHADGYRAVGARKCESKGDLLFNPVKVTEINTKFWGENITEPEPVKNQTDKTVNLNLDLGYETNGGTTYEVKWNTIVPHADPPIFLVNKNSYVDYYSAAITNHKEEDSYEEQKLSDSDIDTLANGNWFFDDIYGTHLLKDSYQINQEDGMDVEISFHAPEILSPVGAENIIKAQTTLQNWNLSSMTNGKVSAYIHMTDDGTDPRYKASASANLNAHTGTGADAVLITSDSACPRYAGDSMTVKARVKIVIHDGDNNALNDVTFWSPISERVFTIEDTYIDTPILQMKKETDDEFVDYETSMAYALGTTQMQLLVPEQKQFQMYYYFGSKTGLKIGDTDPGNGFVMTVENLMSKLYPAGSKKTLSDSSENGNEDMIILEDSNRIYLYVLAVTSNSSRYKLYEYDIVTFVKDSLMYAEPENESRVPSGSSVLIKAGNGKSDEYPYEQIRVLVSSERITPLPVTLDGMTGVNTYSDHVGSGSETDPWYLKTEIKLSGDAGKKFYVYVEPIVNSTGKNPDGSNLPEDRIPYDQRYSAYVQEFEYTIMENSQQAKLSPTSVKTSESGEPTAISVDGKIYITSAKNTDLILYNKTGQKIDPKMVTDSNALISLENLKEGDEGFGETAAIKYWEDKQNQVLYVKNNDIWYSLEDIDPDIHDAKDESLIVYEDGNLSFDKSYENQNAYVSVIVFSDGCGYSANDIYVYHVQEQGAVKVPVALLASGTGISMGRMLNFSSETGTVIYYTTDGREPQITVDAVSGAITPAANTYRYDVATGISVTESNGFYYGQTMTLKMLACPVVDENADTLQFNDKKKSSAAVTFTYDIALQNQVEAPTSYPETIENSPLEVKNGDTIALSCQTSEAEIYYTIDGTTPDPTKNKYTGVITVDGEYGGYFTVKAVACKADMKDSEIVTFLYKIAAQETVGDITAIPGTATTVVAGDKIILSAVTPGAQIFYTTDGSVPKVHTKENNGELNYEYSEPTKLYDPAEPITVTEGSGYFIIKAIAVKKDLADSEVIEFVYTYADEVGAPYSNVSTGAVAENTQIILLSGTKDAKIYYEIGYGSEPADPTQASAVFSDKAPIIINRDTVIKAYAVYDRRSSEIVTLRYTLAEKMPNPTASITSGAVVPSGTKIQFSAANGTVYYTTDGSDPLDAANPSVNYGNSVVIAGKPGDVVSVNICTKKTGATSSETVTLTYQISQYPGGVKADLESGATVSNGDVVHFTTDVTNGTIYYTYGTGSPVTSGTAGNSAVLSGSPGTGITLKAVAIAAGTEMNGSYASFQYQFKDQLAAPSASLQNGTILTKESNLVLKANRGSIYYTIDGSEPTRNSYKYEYPIVVYKDMIVKAIAIEEGFEDSNVSFFSYTFADRLEGLRASKQSGVLLAGEVVELTTDNPNAVIYYTTDGSDPDPDAQEGTFRYNAEKGIAVYRNVSIKAIAVQEGLQDSEILSLSYQVDNVPAQEEKQEAMAEAEAKALEESLKTLNTESLGDRRDSVDEVAKEEEITLHDMNNGSKMAGSTEVLSKDMTLSVKMVNVSKNDRDHVKQMLGSEYEILENYEVNLYQNGRKLQPQKPVTLALVIPAEHLDADVSIIYSNESGQVKLLDTVRKDGYAYAEVSHLKKFGIVGAKPDDDGFHDADWIKVLTGCAGALILAGLAMIIRIKRKRNYEEI